KFRRQHTRTRPPAIMLIAFRCMVFPAADIRCRSIPAKRWLECALSLFIENLNMTLLRPRHRETVFLTAVHGFLGQHTLRTLLDESRCDLVLSARQEKLLYDDLGNEPRIVAYEQLDLSDRIKVRDTLLRYKPDVIVNCAGFVNVDLAEKD